MIDVAVLNEKVQRVLDLEAALREMVKRCHVCHGTGRWKWTQRIGGEPVQRRAGLWEGPMTTVYIGAKYEDRDEDCPHCRPAREALGTVLT